MIGFLGFRVKLRGVLQHAFGNGWRSTLPVTHPCRRIVPAMNSPHSGVDRSEMRVGSVALLLGGTGGFVANLFHPHDFPNETEPLLRFVSERAHWSQLHFLIMISVVLLVCGLAMLTRNL